MAIRWQTLILLVALIGVAGVAILHRTPASPSEASEASSSGYYEPTATEAASAYAALSTPRAFSRTTVRCVGGLCFDRRRSLVPSISKLRGWLSEAGLAMDARWAPEPQCTQSRIRHGGYSMDMCVAIATRGRVFFLAQLSSLVVHRSGHVEGTAALLGKGPVKLGGQNIAISDFGIPRPEEEHEIAKALKEHSIALRGLPLPGVPLEG